MKRKIWAIGFISFILLATGGLASISKEQQSQESCFSKSLHYTGEGMRYWYEKDDGLKSITGIPYDQLTCKKCHIKSCDVCHAKKQDQKCCYSTEKAKDTETCLSCHTKAKETFEIGKDNGSLDVHIAAGMVCADCHKGQDVHGDGIARHSMRDDGAVKAECTNCHVPKENEIRAHKVHRGKLDCTACHVSNSISCLNCHFGNFLKTGKRKGSCLHPVQDWLLLVNYKGKVTSGSTQTFVYKDKKFIAYAPYFTHAIQSKAKDCVDCHANAAMRLIQKGESVPMATFEDGKMVSYKGVVPLVPEQLEWTFLNKVDDKWVPIENNEPPKIQFVGYGEPLTEVQVKKMGIPFKK